MISLRTTGITLAALLFFCLPVRAEPESLTLQMVIEKAFELYPERVLSDVIQQQGNALHQQASSPLADNPSITIRHENDELTDNFGFKNWEGNIEMPLRWPGQRQRSIAIANATKKEATTLTQFYKWKISSDIRELLWSIKIAQAEEELAHTAVDSAKALEADIDRRVHAGEIAIADQLLARKETLTRKIELKSAVSELAILMDEYKLITGLTEIPNNIYEKNHQALTISSQHPVLIIARNRTARVQAERNNVRLKKRGNPVLTLGARNERGESGAPTDTIMAMELSFPIISKNQSAPDIADAELKYAEQEIQNLNIKRNIEKQLLNAANEKQRSIETFKLSEQQQQLSAERLRLTQRAFELGESDLFTLLQARTQALTSERDLKIRQLEKGRAIARHNQALGVIPE